MTIVDQLKAAGFELRHLGPVSGQEGNERFCSRTTHESPEGRCHPRGHRGRCGRLYRLTSRTRRPQRPRARAGGGAFRGFRVLFVSKIFRSPLVRKQDRDVVIREPGSLELIHNSRGLRFRLRNAKYRLFP